VVMWLSFEHYKLINLLAGLPFEEVMQGYMETDPSLEEMELDDEAELANWEATSLCEEFAEFQVGKIKKEVSLFCIL